jgi:hypothetical protein
LAIALLAAGKLSVTVAAKYSLSAITDAVAHLELGWEAAAGRTTDVISHAAEIRYSRAAL